MKYINLISILILFVACRSGDSGVQLSDKIPGAFKSLEMLTAQRAYPFQDIPKVGIQPGIIQHNKLARLYGERDKTADRWLAKGPLNTAGRTLALALNPLNDSTLYAGTASGGLWRSRRLGLGQSWERVPLGFPVLGVSSIAFAPGDSLTLFIGTGETYRYQDVGTGAAFRSTRGTYGIGILKSEDGGAILQKSLDWSYNQHHGVFAVRIAQSSPNILYAATTDGIYKSMDNGAQWRKVLNVVMGTDLVIHPEDPNWVIVGCGNFNSDGKGIYRTEDGGANWIKIEHSLPDDFNGKIQLNMSPSDPDIVYASIGNGFSSADGATWLCKSEDAGIRWTVLNTTDYSRWQGWFAHDIAVCPNNPEKIMAIGIDIWKSENGGTDLFQVSGGGVTLGTPEIGFPDGPEWYSHSDHHDVIYHPHIENLILFANDGGVFLSFDDGASFQSANGGFQSTQFYNGFSVSHLDPDLALGGLQDNSTAIFRGDAAWQRAVGGDGSWTAINQLDNNIIYASYQQLNIMKSYNRGMNFDQFLSVLAEGDRALFIAPYLISTENPSLMYAGARSVYKSIDGGDTWVQTNQETALGTGKVFSMALCESNPDIVYAATAPEIDRAQVFVCFDGGDNWLNITNDLPDRFPNDLEVHPFDGNIAYICFSGFGAGHLFKTENGGLTWEDISQDLPDIPGNAIAIDPADPSHIYYGNDIAVYFSPDEGASWEIFSEGLIDAVLVMDLKISPLDRKLWLASHGNGAYTRNLISPSTSTTEISHEPNYYFKAEILGNPIIDNLLVQTNSKQHLKARSRILDTNGRLVWQDTERFSISPGIHQIQIAVSSLYPGLYFYQIESAGQVLTLKFVKH